MRARPGFTLIEVVLATVLIYLLTSIAVPQYRNALDLARTARAIAEIQVLQSEIAGYVAQKGSVPSSLVVIGRGSLLDPWGQPYVYLPFPPCTGPPGGGAGGGRGGGGGGCGGPPAGARKDRFLVPINSDYDLYSKGPDRQSQPPLTAKASRDDIIRANDGGFIGVAVSY